MKVKDLKINVLYLGRVECNRYHLVKTDDEKEMITSPMVATLIQHPTLGNILYDTGNDWNWEETYPESIKETYPLCEFISIKDRLAEHGLTPYDIDILIISHLHFDHSGGVKYFANTDAGMKIIVAEDDLKNALYNISIGEGGAYVKSLFDMDGIRYAPINGEVNLADDLTLFVQKSHTPGVIGMVVKTKNNGNIIFTGDTIYTKDSYEKELPPGGSINKTDTEFFDNLKFIKEMEKKYNATIFYGHDYDQVREWEKKSID